MPRNKEARNKEDGASLPLRLGSCWLQSRHVFGYCHLGWHAQGTSAQAESDLDKRSVASLAPFIERYPPPSC